MQHIQWLLFFMFASCTTLSPQSPNTPQWTTSTVQFNTIDTNDPSSFIGLTLAELLSLFGVPMAVYPERGLEDWQDDVIFIYNNGLSFYVYKDRVWQLSLQSAYGVNVGDSRSSSAAMLRWPVENYDNCTLYSLPSRGWPLVLRLDFIDSLVSVIRIYRSDF
ncbi:MAG: hypothetical protein LBK00_04420 [Treponema sp.]|jgi:hypothetical protein|nr:hypothetical protein [Treponema sp.]